MSEIEPALSPEEWADALDYARMYGETVARLRAGMGVDDTSHYLAALALHGQPFGFTWADVDLLKLARSIVGGSYGPGSEEELFDSLADRIAALLPPREP